MCGIAGAFGQLDDVVREAMAKAAGAMAHRGPDADGVFEWSDAGRGVVLHHRRLSIIDLSPTGAQPMQGPGGDVICYNGEVYNYRELGAELAARGQRYRSTSDTEVILAAHQHLGADAPTRLRGMFAYALWQPAARELLLVRDRFGMKPLYWTRIARPGGDTMLFASELRALLATGLVPRVLDPVGRDSYLWNGFVAGPATAIRGVTLLAPATVQRWRLADLRVEERRYWSMPAPAATPAPDRVERLREALAGSVAHHLIADVPVGVFLSGGIDSSAVAALARRSAGDVRTFVLGFDEADYDESRHAREVAQRLGTRHTEVRLSQADFVTRLDAAIASLDQPTFDGINTWFVARAARDSGVIVALAGTGGDELFGGYHSFRDLPRLQRALRRLRWLPGGLRRGLGRALRPLLARTPSATGQQVRLGKLPELLAEGHSLAAAYQIQYALYNRDFLHAMRPDYGLAATLGVPAAEHGELLALANGGNGATQAAIGNLELRMFLGQRLLRDTDAAAMASSLEVRLPLVDHEVLAAVSGLTAAERFTTPPKRLLRELGMPGLPAALFDRPKAGFTLPFDRWCRDAARADMDATLRDTAQVRAAGLAPEPVARLWQSFLAGHPGIYWSRVWALYAWLRWQRQHRVDAG